MSTFRALIASLALATVAGQASAASVTTQLSSVDADTWQASFLVLNDGSVTPLLEGITFYFEPSASTFNVTGMPAGWNALISEPDPLLGPGLVDFAADPGPGLSTGQQALYTVHFDWTGASPPSASLPFEIYTQTPDFTVLGSGVTTAVPEPATAMLALTGGALLWARRRRAQAAAA